MVDYILFILDRNIFKINIKTCPEMKNIQILNQK